MLDLGADDRPPARARRRLRRRAGGLRRGQVVRRPARRRPARHGASRREGDRQRCSTRPPTPGCAPTWPGKASPAHALRRRSWPHSLDGGYVASSDLPPAVARDLHACGPERPLARVGGDPRPKMTDFLLLRSCSRTPSPARSSRRRCWCAARSAGTTGRDGRGSDARPSTSAGRSAICFCLAGSVSLAKASRSFSIVSSHGQPNSALSHDGVEEGRPSPG